MNRREFIQAVSIATMAGYLPVPKNSMASTSFDFDYRLPSDGNVRLMHITDVHGQLLPVRFREPNVNIGIGTSTNKPPHLVGDHALSRYGIRPGTPEAHAFTYLGFEEATLRFGKMGGFAHLKTLIRQLRSEFGHERTLLLDGGDTWQGSATALWTQGQDMVRACNALGVDVMTGHWEFTYPESMVRRNIEQFDGDFVAQNIFVKEEALFEGAEAYDEDAGFAFKPYTVKRLGGISVAVIGQAFPYTPIANPGRYVANWSFGIREQELQKLVNHLREVEQVQVVTLLSHNGMDVDLKLAKRTSGIDVIFGGHTHDAVPHVMSVSNAAGRTLVTNAGSAGKFVGVMDLKVGKSGISGYRYRLLPVFSELLAADDGMNRLINDIREPYLEKLQQPLAIAGELLYRRGNFIGSFDQVLCDSLTDEYDAQIALSPGFRWGPSILPGETITYEDVMAHTGITYPESYVREMSGEELKLVLEDVCDNLFNKDAYRQQGGDMVRTGGLEYVCAPDAMMGDRIRDMKLRDGESIKLNKKYKVAGWATVNSIAPGRAIENVAADYLKKIKTVQLEHIDRPKIVGVDGNEGLV